MPSNPIGRLVIQRLLALIPLLVLLSFAVYGLLLLAPGGPERALLGGRPATPEVLESIRARYHLDEPFLAQYARWASGVVTLDFGRSIVTGQHVTTLIASRAGLTVLLGGYAFVLTIALGIPLGVLAALRPRTAVDRGLVATTVLGVSAPAFVTGILLIYLFAVVLRWLPTFGPGDDFPDQMRHLTLPAIALALGSLALVLKITRSTMLEELGKDYIAFARVRGLTSWRVVVGHAMRNARLPIITGAGLVFVHMITGAVLVEVTFSLPGIGSLMVDSVKKLDIPVVQGLVVFIAIFIVAVHLLIDALYAVLDPRVRFGAMSS